MTEIKNERKKVTLKELIERKMSLKQERKYEGTLFIPSLGGDIDIEVLRSDVVDFVDARGAGDEKAVEAAAHNLIYSIVKSPDLSDKEFQKEFECVEPTDIVEHLFTDGEMLDIVDLAIAGVGMRAGVVEEVKN